MAELETAPTRASVAKLAEAVEGFRRAHPAG